MQDIIKTTKIVGLALGIAIIIGVVFWTFSEPEIKYFYVDNNFGIYKVYAQVGCGTNKIFYQTFNGREAIEVYKELNESLEKPRKIRN